MESSEDLIMALPKKSGNTARLQSKQLAADCTDYAENVRTIRVIRAIRGYDVCSFAALCSLSDRVQFHNLQASYSANVFLNPSRAVVIRSRSSTKAESAPGTFELIAFSSSTSV